MPSALVNNCRSKWWPGRAACSVHHARQNTQRLILLSRLPLVPEQPLPICAVRHIPAGAVGVRNAQTRTGLDTTTVIPPALCPDHPRRQARICPPHRRCSLRLRRRSRRRSAGSAGKCRHVRPRRRGHVRRRQGSESRRSSLQRHPTASTRKRFLRHLASSTDSRCR